MMIRSEMSDFSDYELLQRFAHDGEDAAFRELVERYGPVAHGVALRRLQSPEAAHDVMQEAFVTLAKKAGSLNANVVLGGWLHKVTYAKSIDYIRSESRRKKREEQYAMDHINENESHSKWEELSPVLDSALCELSSPDRNAIVLRYFQNQPNRVVASSLGISEEAAKKRVSRAVGKLKSSLLKRGCVLGPTGLASLSAHAAVPLPTSAVLEFCQTATSAAGGSLAASSTSTLISIMTLKSKFSALAAIITLGAAGVIATNYISGSDSEKNGQVSDASRSPERERVGSQRVSESEGDRRSRKSSGSFRSAKALAHDLDFQKAVQHAEAQVAIMLIVGEGLKNAPERSVLKASHGMDEDVAKVVEKHIDQFLDEVREGFLKENNFLRENKEEVGDYLALVQLQSEQELTATQAEYLTFLKGKGLEEKMEFNDAEGDTGIWYRDAETLAEIREEIPSAGIEQFENYLENIETLDRESEAFGRSQNLARELNLSGEQRQEIFERLYENENESDFLDILNPEQREAYQKLQSESSAEE